MVPRGSLGLALGALLLALASPTADAGRSACQALRGSYDFAPAKRVKLVERRNHRGRTDLVGCVLPRGRPITVESRFHDRYQSNDYVLKGVRGHQVRVQGTFRLDGDPGRATDTRVFDLKRRRWYRIASFCSLRLCNNNVPVHQLARRSFIDADGQAAAAVENTSRRKIVIKAFSRDGVERVLDHGTKHEIRPSSLLLRGHVVTWRHSGHSRSAVLSG